MVGSSKVLTVSYGTFSCTLEGFDDSFDTMKAIAEYFRDLAADDRYFGAEPPTPDAEMLARIAEREIARRVEARMSDGGIHLRAADATMPRAQVAATPARVASAPVSQAEPTMPPSAVAQPAAAMPRTAPMPSESVAAKLQRIRSVVGKSAVQPAEFIEDLAPSQEFVEAEEIEELTFGYEESAPESQAPVAPVTEAVSEESILEETLEEDASITSILSEVEPEVAEEVEDDEPQAHELADIDEEEAEPEIVDEDELDEEDALLGRLTAELDEVDLEEDDHEEVDLEEDDLEAQDEADEALAAEEETPDTDDTLLEEIAAAVAPEAPAPQAEEAPKDLRALARNRVRVIRMKRASEDFERTLTVESSDTSIFADAEDDLEDEAPAVAAKKEVNLADLDGLDEFDVTSDALSDEEEAELLRELSQIEEDAEEDDFDDEDDFVAEAETDAFEEEYDEAPVHAPAPSQNPLRRMGRALLDRAPDQSDDVNRIADRADQHLREPESNRRREAFSQLKAAVAATEAARMLGEKQETEETRENPFRRVLDQVVRPRSAKAEEERPRPAPLKLVASQRVDVAPVEAPKSGLPVMPRRIAVQSNAVRKEEIEQDASGFAQFASDMGAQSIEELLEAAAAHTTFVEGLEDFSRPQVMRKLMEIDTFDREDSLRAFGTLLREGRIAKVRNGRFAISEDTDYRP